mmetsp:Transcript_22073/g.44454  ORF Transcript_22073/g.44454 Transcript_22073/m.44454 type:complete len:132 (-) Transcript_22073:93-488(-)
MDSSSTCTHVPMVAGPMRGSAGEEEAAEEEFVSAREEGTPSPSDGTPSSSGGWSGLLPRVKEDALFLRQGDLAEEAYVPSAAVRSSFEQLDLRPTSADPSADELLMQSPNRVRQIITLWEWVSQSPPARVI